MEFGSLISRFRSFFLERFDVKSLRKFVVSTARILSF